MLSETCRELLAAYVDGELNTRQQDAVRRLLHGSAEAREMLRRMQGDAAALRQLPRQRLDRDLSGPVMRMIAERGLRPESQRHRLEARRPNLSAWAGFSAAAAALLLVALGSYLYFSTSQENGRDDAVVAKGKTDLTARPSERGKDGSRQTSPPPSPKKDTAIAVAEKAPETELVPPPAQALAANEPGPAKTPEAEVLAAPDPVAGMEMFKVAPVTQLQIVKLADLDMAPRRQQLLTDLRKEPAYRMESPVKDSIRAFDRLQSVLTARGIGLAIDQTAQARMNASARLMKIKTNFVLYVEDVTPDELVQLLQSVAAEDRKTDKTKKGDFLIEAVVVNAMTDADREELCKLMGQKGRKLPDPPSGPLGTDVRKPVADKTADDIAKSLTGQSAMPRPEPGKMTTKPQERLALAMPYNPVRPRSDSPEIKRFLGHHKPPRPGSLQALLVLREMSS